MGKRGSGPRRPVDRDAKNARKGGIQEECGITHAPWCSGAAPLVAVNYVDDLGLSNCAEAIGVTPSSTGRSRRTLTLVCRMQATIPGRVSN